MTGDYERPHPRPWRVNPDFNAPSNLRDPPPIFDADGYGVMEPSEWLVVTDETLALIVKAVNAWKE